MTSHSFSDWPWDQRPEFTSRKWQGLFSSPQKPRHFWSPLRLFSFGFRFRPNRCWSSLAQSFLAPGPQDAWPYFSVSLLWLSRGPYSAYLVSVHCPISGLNPPWKYVNRCIPPIVEVKNGWSYLVCLHFPIRLHITILNFKHRKNCAFYVLKCTVYIKT
jgi:hypothetical protein